MSLVRGVRERMWNINEIKRELSSHQSRFLCFLVDTYPSSFSPLPTRKGCFAWPSLLQLCVCAAKMNWRKQVGTRQGEKEQSKGSFSVFLCVTAMGEMAYIFLLWSIKITCYTSKGMSLSKGSSSCSLFNHLLTTCGSAVDENKAAFSSNSSPEFCFSQYSDSIIHPAPRTKGFT